MECEKFFCRYEATGIRPEFLGDAMSFKKVQRKNLTPMKFFGRDTAKYPPLMKTRNLSKSLKYLTKAYLGK